MDVNESALYRHIGKRVRERRNAAGLTQCELGEAAGMLRTSITNIEAGRQKAPLHVLYKLCEALGIEVRAVLPNNAEIVASGTVPRAVEGVMRAMPPKTAALLDELMAGEENGGYDVRIR